MTVALLAFLGGVLTILSPCILPVLPFIFVRSDRSFIRDTLPLLLGMAAAFTLVGTLAAVGGHWAVQVNTWGRIAALIVLFLLGVALLLPRVAEWLARPAVALGNRLLNRGTQQTPSGMQSVLIGVATGFLWAPCAGPILGLILTGAALSGPNAQTSLLLLAYALGAITSLAVAMLAGQRVFSVLKRSAGVSEWLRRGAGVAVLTAVVAIALGWDTGVLTRLSLNSTNRLEQSLMDLFPSAQDTVTSSAMMMQGGPAMQGGAAMQGTMAMSMTATGSSQGLPIEGPMPSLEGATSWLNSMPLSSADLQGKVVLIDFWTYSCINCLRTLPYTKAWHERYKDKGLIVIGVHSPEFAFEKVAANVQRAVRDYAIPYAVALDSNHAIWQAFRNQYWPAQYFIDAHGQIRAHHFGEGDEAQSESILRNLLTEAGATDLPPETGVLRMTGVQAAAEEAVIQSPETYVGYDRAENFISTPAPVRDAAAAYTMPTVLQLNQWGLVGQWQVAAESARALSANAKISFRFHARDLHLVLGTEASATPLRFRVTIDGKPPGKDRGVDINEQGLGTVTDHRLYQLIRQSGEIRDRTFTIEFLDAGVQAYAFTFG